MPHINTIPTPQDPKRRRQEAVIEIVRSGRVATQQEIVHALRARHLEATQVSVSRDIAELGLFKTGGYYVVPAAGGVDVEAPLRAYLSSAESAGPNLIVLKCETGTAPRIGLAVDQTSRTGLMGTIAGDDTVFVATSDAAAGRDLLRWFRSLIPSGRR